MADEINERVHSTWNNMRVAAAPAISGTGLLALGALSQVYAVVYKVPVDQIVAVTIGMTVWNLLNQIITGALQDQEALSRCFHKEKYGRRSPWIITHTPLAAIIMFLLWYPPFVDPDSLLIWFAIMIFFAYWVFSTLMVAGYSGIAELYPFKEERLRVDFWILIWSIIFGLFILGSTGLVLIEGEGEGEGDKGSGIDNATTPVDSFSICNGTQEEKDEFNLAVSKSAKEASLGPAFVLALLMFLACLAVKPLNEAQKRVENSVKNPLADILELLKRHDAYRVYIIFSIWNSLEVLLDFGFIVYYLSYISALTGFERTAYFGAIPITAYIIVAVSGLYWVEIFSNQRKNPTRYTQVGLFLHAITRPFFIFFSTDPLVFAFAFTLRTVLVSPAPFLDTSVRNWIIDEDCQRNPGKRREGIILGFRAAVRVFGVIGISLLTIGMAAAGIDTTLPDGCPQENTGILYINIMLGVLSPLICLLEVGLIEMYPIKGERLDKLLEKQRLEMAEVYQVEL